MCNVICSECSERLRNYGFICFDLMQRICEVYLDANIVALAPSCPTYLHTIVSFLERKGLLVSSDIELDIMLKPNGRYDPGRNVYCWCKRRL